MHPQLEAGWAAGADQGTLPGLGQPWEGLGLDPNLESSRLGAGAGAGGRQAERTGGSWFLEVWAGDDSGGSWRRDDGSVFSLLDGGAGGHPPRKVADGSVPLRMEEEGEDKMMSGV